MTDTSKSKWLSDLFCEIDVVVFKVARRFPEYVSSLRDIENYDDFHDELESELGTWVPGPGGDGHHILFRIKQFIWLNQALQDRHDPPP